MFVVCHSHSFQGMETGKYGGRFRKAGRRGDAAKKRRLPQEEIPALQGAARMGYSAEPGSFAGKQ
jgi:hypothetical protein